MLSVSALSARELAARLAGGLTLATGPFRFRIQSGLPAVATGLHTLYADFPVEPDDGLRHFHAEVTAGPAWRRWLRPQAEFLLDGFSPFRPLPAEHAFALLEWGMNFCIAGHAHHYLMLHAAVLERDGLCVVLPGEPGAGKSTLTAALALSGWRLLSDELTLVDRADGRVRPLARPVGLKNESIDVIARFSPGVTLGPVSRDTHKGTVSHMKPPADSVRRMHETAQPTHVVFPRWRAGASTRLRPRGRADAFMHLASHAFNYTLLGRLGFELMAALVDGCRCWDFEYADLGEAISAFEGLRA